MRKLFRNIKIMIHTSVREWLLLGLMFTLFFEADMFTFNLSGLKIRSVQFVEASAILFLFINFISQRIKFKLSNIDYSLMCLLAVNILSISNAVWVSRGFKISILMFSLVLLYQVVYNLLNSQGAFL